MSPLCTMTEAGRMVVDAFEEAEWSRPNATKEPAVTSAATSAPTRPPMSAERPVPPDRGGSGVANRGSGGVHAPGGAPDGVDEDGIDADGGGEVDAVQLGVHPYGRVGASETGGNGVPGAADGLGCVPGGGGAQGLGATGLGTTGLGTTGLGGTEVHPGGSPGGGTDEPTEASPGSPGGAVDDPGETDGAGVGWTTSLPWGGATSRPAEPSA
jgi:hypothetical protein